MRKIFILLLFIVSCNPKFTPLKSSYPEPPYIIESSKSKEQVWDKIIDLFAQKGLPIKIIDKSSGLIISEQARFKTTTETLDGKPVNTKAWLIVPGRYNKFDKKYYMKTNGGDLVAEWNVRIKEVGNKTSINVNIVNIKDEYLSQKGLQLKIEYNVAKSTGVFEKMIADLIN